MVGGYIDANGVGHGFVMLGGAFSTIDIPGASGTGATAINNGGTIVGVASGVGAFIVESGGQFSIVALPGAFTTQFYGINSFGQIVGINSAPSGFRGLFRDTTGTTTLLDVPGAKRTDAFGINDCGQIVGDFQDASGTFHGFLSECDAPSTREPCQRGRLCPRSGRRRTLDARKDRSKRPQIQARVVSGNEEVGYG